MKNKLKNEEDQLELKGDKEKRRGWIKKMKVQKDRREQKNL